MKKNLLFTVVLLLGLTTAYAQAIDTVVSKVPSNKNVVLEAFTGIYCSACPKGHYRANQILQNHPGRVCVINVHEGDYANNTYTTVFGSYLSYLAGVRYYPSGTVNRHVFSGSYASSDPDLWESYANIILNQSSPVNIAAWGTLDMSNRQLHLTVQLYYTANSSSTTNRLNVAILQDNVLGTQSGAYQNPSQIVGSQYNHMHMLRHLITGQWGEAIYTTTAGSFVQKEYTFTIPQSFGTNPVEAVLKDLKFVAFVAEGTQEILTGVEADVQMVNLPAVALEIKSFKNADVKVCEPVTSTYFEIFNSGSDDLHNMTIQYKGPSDDYQTYNWVGNIAANSTGYVYLPHVEVLPNVAQTVKASILSANGVDVNTIEYSISVKEHIYSIDGPCHFVLTTDQYASETSFKVFAPNGDIILSDGNFMNLSSPGTTLHEYDFTPTVVGGCYRLEVYDEDGDGINTGYGLGNFKLYKSDGSSLIFSNNGKFGDKAVYKLIAFSALGVEDNEEALRIYPNPASTQINIESDSQILRVEMFNLQGQMVQAQSGDIHKVSLDGVSNGIYMLKVTTEKGTIVQKIVKQ